MTCLSRKSLRLSHYDYKTNGSYFLTLCTKKRENLFWDNYEIINSKPTLSAKGIIVSHCISNLPVVLPMVHLDCFSLMDNHVHFLLTLENDNEIDCSQIIRRFKSAVTKRICINIWQRSFFDRIVRDENEFRQIYEYIINNPEKWREDKICKLRNNIRTLNIFVM